MAHTNKKGTQSDPTGNDIELLLRQYKRGLRLTPTIITKLIFILYSLLKHSLPYAYMQLLSSKVKTILNMILLQHSLYWCIFICSCSCVTIIPIYITSCLMTANHSSKSGSFISLQLQADTKFSFCTYR